MIELIISKMIKRIKTILYLRIIVIICVFFIAPIYMLTLLDELFYILFVAIAIVVLASGEGNILKLNETSLLLLSNLSFLSFFLFSMLFEYEIMAVFLYSFTLAYSLLYYKFNKLSWLKYQKDIDVVGGPGFNISRDNTRLGVKFSVLTLILAIFYFFIFIIFN